MLDYIKTTNKRTKVIATLGPSVTGRIFTWNQFNDPKNSVIVQEAYKNMEDLFKHGVNVVRLNFSHGTWEEQEIRIKITRDVAQSMSLNIGIMLDTKGPEIRVGRFPNDKEVKINIGEIITINTINHELPKSEKEFYVYDSTKTYNMAKDVKVGNLILVDDGKLQLEIQKIDVAKGLITVQALNTHTICENKRINLPWTRYTLPFLSEQDERDIKFAIKNKLDYIALSFVNSPEDIKLIREILRKNNASPHLQLIAKIESTEAIRNIDLIIKEANGIMIARGDLALEIPFYDIPYWEKYILKACRYIGKPCIVATQMLDSLERNIQPTRAEVTDVFFAVDRGCDATMLSGETAKGSFPIQAVKVMSIIDSTAEKMFDYQRSRDVYYPHTNYPGAYKKIARAIAKKALPDASLKEDIKFPIENVIIFTNDSELIWAISAIKPATKIVVVTTDKEILNKFSLNYGIKTWYVENLNELKLRHMNYAQQIVAKLKLSKAMLYYNKKFYKL